MSNAHCAKLRMQSSFQGKRQLVGRVRSPAFRRIPRQQSLDLITILDAAFQFGSHPTYSSVGNNTRGVMAQLSIPDQGSYLELILCTILSSEINNNKSIKMVTKGGRNVPQTQIFVSRDIVTSSFTSAAFCLQPAAIIIVFSISYLSPFSLGWCGAEPEALSWYSYRSTSHC